MPLPLIPILLWGGGAALVGGLGFGVAKSTDKLITITAIGGAAYFVYKASK